MMTFLQIQSFATLVDQLPVGVEESDLIDRASSGAHGLVRGDGFSRHPTDSDDIFFAPGPCLRPSRGLRGTAPTGIRSDSAPCGYRSDDGARFAHERAGPGSGLKMEGYLHSDGIAPQQNAAAASRGNLSADFHSGLGINCGAPQSSLRMYANSQCETYASRPSCDRNDSACSTGNQGGWAYSQEDSHSGTFEPYHFPQSLPSSAPAGCIPLSAVNGTGCGTNHSWQSLGYSGGPQGILEGQHDESLSGSCSVAASDGFLSVNSGGRNQCPMQSAVHEVGSLGGQYGGGQVQVSVVAPQTGANKAPSIILGIRTPPNGREDLVVASYTRSSDWQGTGGCQVGVTHMARPNSPRSINSLSRRQSAPASTKVKSLAPSGPDHFVLCLEGDSGHEQHVSIERLDLLLAANAHVSALAEQERIAGKGAVHDRGPNLSSSGSRQNVFMGPASACDVNADCCWADDIRCNGVPVGSGAGSNDMWSVEVRKWRTHMCREIEQQKRRLLLREEACRKREEEFRQKEDEAKRQRMTIAALEGEVMKVTEEMQEILLEREEGRLLVQRDFLGRKCQYISRLQELRPHLGTNFEDVFRAVSNCRTIGQLSTWSSVFDSTEDADPKVAASRLMEVIHSGAAAPYFVPSPTSPTSACFSATAGDTWVRSGSAKSGARNSALESCIIRIPSLTIDSSVIGDGTGEPPGDMGMAVFPRMFGIGDDSRTHPLSVSDAWAKSRCSHLNSAGNDDALSPQDGSAGLLTQVGGIWENVDASADRWLGPRAFDSSHLPSIKEAATSQPGYNIVAGTNAVHAGATPELGYDGLCFKPLCSRLPSRSTSICGDSEAHQPEWAPCRIESRHAEEGFEGPGSEGCVSWMERVACGSGAGSLSISFFNAAPRSQRAPSPIYG